MDNTGAMQYINKFGGTRSANVSALTTELAHWCAEHKWRIEAVHIAGKLNTEADGQSLAKSESSDWKLNHAQFTVLQQLWPSQVDLFASRCNARRDCYAS